MRLGGRFLLEYDVLNRHIAPGIDGGILACGYRRTGGRNVTLRGIDVQIARCRNRRLTAHHVGVVGVVAIALDGGRAGDIAIRRVERDVAPGYLAARIGDVARGLDREVVRDIDGTAHVTEAIGAGYSYVGGNDLAAVGESGSRRIRQVDDWSEHGMTVDHRLYHPDDI